ncbi:MAG: hypothetical protein ACXACX_13135 [Candidatus Hodarchaeales archaeon]|jgi:hypothetical protein
MIKLDIFGCKEHEDEMYKLNSTYINFLMKNHQYLCSIANCANRAFMFLEIEVETKI